MTEYRCMSREELLAWLEAAAQVRGGSDRPCADCPVAFQRAAGSLCIRPVAADRTRAAMLLDYPTELRRRQWREAKRRARRRETWDNRLVGSSDTSENRMPPAPSRSLTLQGGVAASRGQD